MATLDHPVLLVVLDGWGYREDATFNAIHHAFKPHWDRMWKECPHGLLECSGHAVGLPEAQMGNSEVGHMHLGAGRLLPQDLTRISDAIRNGEFLLNPVLREACAAARRNNRTLHLMGLLSPGGVHSHEDHLLALLELTAREAVPHVRIHAFLDGRDTPPRSALPSLLKVEAQCARLPDARLATLVGRYYAMDRNKSWERTALAHALLVDGQADYRFDSATAALQAAYARGEGDEFVKPTLLAAQGTEARGIEDGDIAVFINFRADRARQLTEALTAETFGHFARTRHPRLDRFVSMTDYGAEFSHVPVAFPTLQIADTFGELVAKAGLRQLRIAETEKYAHVTFFFNGGEEHVFPGEDRILVPSPRIATYDLKPEMSAVEVTDRLVAALQSREYDAIICNYANADMVGHTGDFDATVRCIETLDACLGRIREACASSGTELLITADHGNAEQMRAAEDTEAHTAHTSNLVPLLYVGRAAEVQTGGSLKDVAPTLLTLMGLPVPAAMTGRPLITPRVPGARDAA